MKEVIDFFKNLFEYKDFRSFWESGSWTQFHGWFYIISDLLVWSAYFIIPILILFYVVKKKKPAGFNKVYLLFALFILFSGATYFVDALMFWVPTYRISALIRFVTGAISWIAVFYVVKILPKAFSMRSGEEMQQEIDNRKEVEKELKQKNEQLQEAEKIAKIGYIKWDVMKETVELSEAAEEILDIKIGRDVNYGNFSSIIHEDDVKHLEKVIDTIFIKKLFPDFYCRVVTKSKEVRHVLVRGEVILTDTGLISVAKGTIQDVTEQRLFVQKIQLQNQKLKDIAWIQSHKVRAPVASIMGLVQLINKDNMEDPMNEQVLDGIAEAAETLDRVIKEINAKTGTMTKVNQ